MYQFSIPMPYTKDCVEKIKSINSQVEKSKITSLYFALPQSDINFTGFEQGRIAWKFKTNFNNWIEILTYIKENGFEFIYLLNAPHSVDIFSDDIDEKLKKLDFLINKLYEMGLKKFRVSNPRLLTYLHSNYPELELYTSTSFEYTSLKQYQTFIEMYPYVKQIVPSHDVNKNFKLLKNLKKYSPNMDYELIVNEGCLGGCPLRNFHAANFGHKKTKSEVQHGLEIAYYANMCAMMLKNNPYLFICKSQNIYPWEIEEYAKIGYTKFKIVGRDWYKFNSQAYFDNCLTYLKGIDNYKTLEKVSLSCLNHHVAEAPLPYVKDIRPLLPKIEHFKKYGHLCASICGEECLYCYKCAEKINKKFKTNPFC